MYSVTLDQRQYPTYVLADHSAHTQVEVVPSRGGIVTSWQVRGQEIFYLDQERFKDPGLSVRGGIPILFPICGNLPDNSYTYGNATYQLKQHGFGREMGWAAGAQSTTDGASLQVTLTHTPETLAVYPFEFQLTFTYTLKGNTLAIAASVSNRSSQPMPFALGLHPYFAAPDKSQLAIAIPGSSYLDKERNSYSFDGKFDFEQAEIDVAFEQLSEDRATVVDGALGTSLTVTWDQHHPVLVFWTVKGKDFYCLEPWTAPRNAMVSGQNLITLAPGETVDMLVTMAIALTNG
ncbi:MAG: aldose epimerase [Pseudanabaenaceae cyanobacterium bins.68]|nr:aldose epimerase [Pseudanabaenaceae cyanobacterium bins.68]